MSNRDTTTPIRTVFGNVEKGTQCRVCERNVDDGRAKYCSEYCRRVARATMTLLNFNGVKRLVKKRDGYQCVECGFDFEKERKASHHIRHRIEKQLSEVPDGPSLTDNMDEFDMESHLEQVEKRDQRKMELQERYGDPHQYAKGLEVDHITPISEGGHPFDPGNLQTLCTACHQDKTAREASERAEQRTPSKGELSETIFEYVDESQENGKIVVDPDAEEVHFE